MELLPLPDFHHILMATIVITLLLIPTLFVAAIVKKNKKTKTKPPKDIYELSIALQELAPNDKEVQKLLDEVAKYKYNPKAPSIPKELYKKMIKLYKDLIKQYNKRKKDEL
ncbi:MULTISPECIES: hypothetical protein [unclassified Nitratiruptor]|uniref:hypothetical protein n=1 Tax=unclassified Nitratiruptor TaxID=2624044 RepID=UPI00191569A7|nr:MULTISPECIES: hypothetical protein [unclassified Nitratiruptor]BCD59886.1 hypothetical protein NitYY0810_C0645 [Nitratiruptor sp. YY08-10]BCD63809.1 hypothetical protein NitYY0814_C0644 [Nitratiruptor sp. YY08-14]